MHAKLNRLQDALASYETLAIAFSGGVDSTFLLAVTHEVLGSAACAIMARTPLVPTDEFASAEAFCAERGIRLLAFDENQIETVPGFSQNPPDRCYICKKALFTRIIALAGEAGCAHVADGSNADDAQLYRPGAQALAEIGVASPLADAGLTKQDIRALSHEMGLPTWNKPSLACMASRFEYNTQLSIDAIANVMRAERALFAEGFSQARVRVHGDIARIEVPAIEIERFADSALRERVVQAVADAGFKHVTLDLRGFRIGSMDE